MKVIGLALLCLFVLAACDDTQPTSAPTFDGSSVNTEGVPRASRAVVTEDGRVLLVTDTQPAGTGTH